MVMKKSFKKIMAAGILATLAVGTIGATAAFADDGSDDEYKQNMDLLRDAIDSNDYDEFISVLSEIDELAVERMTVEAFDQMVEMHELKEEIKDTVETGTYDEWVALVSELPGGQGLIDTVDESEFDTLRELNEAHENRDKETVRELSDELGLTELRDERRENREERQEQRKDDRQNRRSALQSGDYEAWEEAIAGTPAEEKLGDIINEDNFDELAEVHELHKSGEHEEAKAAAEELGLPEKESSVRNVIRGFRARFVGLFR